MLARNGVPAAAIVIGPQAKAEEKLAAAELQDYVRKISGATLPIATLAQRTSLVPSVRIGVFGAEPVRDWRGERPAPDGFALETAGNVLYVVGGDARGALYGGYELIEQSLGVRWFMPGELGEDVPRQPTLALPRVRVRKAPAFGSVQGLVWAGGPGAEAWELRMRAKIGPPISFGHNWYNILPFTPQNFAANPEWFAEVAGVRGRSSQLCSAHPEVVRISADAARRHFDRSPEATLFSISPNDGYGFCEDARCRAVDALYGITDGSLSDRLVHYANQVLADLERTHPGRQAGIYAYVTHSAPPQRARPAAGYATQLVHMPWEYCHAHTVADPACGPNSRFLGYLRGWNAVVRHSGVYEFYGHFFVGATWPIVHALRRDIPLYHELGVERFTSETQQHWATQGLNFYLAAKLLSDPKSDVDALLDEYYRRFYGKASPAMRRYWERWEQAMIASAAQGDGGYEWLRMFTNAVVAETGQSLAEAERLAAGDSDKVQRRVAFVKLGHAYTEAWTQIIESGLRGDVASAVAWGEEAIRRARATQGTSPQALFLYLVEPQTRYLVALATSGTPPWVALRP
jgi:hypothetical protein